MTTDIPKPPRKYYWMLGLAPASFIAWLLVPGESLKMLAGLFTFGLLVVAWLHLAGHLLEWRPHKGLVLLVALAPLASCAGQLKLLSSDLHDIKADMAHFNCEQGRRIVGTGEGLGRKWKRTDQPGQWLASPPGIGSFHDLYLAYRPQHDDFELAVPMPDMPRAYAYCKPDPRAPAIVNSGV